MNTLPIVSGLALITAIGCGISVIDSEEKAAKAFVGTWEASGPLGTVRVTLRENMTGRMTIAGEGFNAGTYEVGSARYTNTGDQYFYISWVTNADGRPFVNRGCNYIMLSKERISECGSDGRVFARIK